MNIGFPDCCDSFCAWTKLVCAKAAGRKMELRKSEREKNTGFMTLRPNFENEIIARRLNSIFSQGIRKPVILSGFKMPFENRGLYEGG